MHQLRPRKAPAFLVTALALAVVAALLTVGAASADTRSAAAQQATVKQSVRQVKLDATATLPTTAQVGTPFKGAQSPEFPRELGADAAKAAGKRQQAGDLGKARSLSRRPKAGSPAAMRAAEAAARLAVPVVTPTPLAGRNPGVRRSFEGLNLFDQRYANNGNQFTVEPPDQGLCVGNGFVLETVNDVLRVYRTSATPASPVVDLNTFYGYPPAIDRATGVFGPFVTDPSCYYDPEHKRFFHLALTLDVVPAGKHAGEFIGTNHLDIAVSQTADPTGSWFIYRLPVQDDG